MDFVNYQGYYREQRCYYKDHLQSQHLTISETRDHLLLEHIRSEHRTGCKPLLASSADEVVQAPPVREETPFDQVTCLQPVSLTDELLSPRHIRLLELYPRTSADLLGETLHVRERTRLLCRAYQASLDDLTTTGQPLFAAASYVCGDQTPTQRITCGCNIIEIPQNAYDVLCHLRFMNRPRLIWIDYLCIKQDDAREKSRQVGMLHAIYSQAHVVSWLGIGRDVDLQRVSFYLSMLSRLWIEQVRECERGLTGGELGRRSRKRLEEYLESQADAFPLEGLVSIYTTDYFKRVWIFQEIILGKTSVCQLGNELYPLAVVAAAANVLLGLPADLPTIGNTDCIRLNHEVILYVLCIYLEPALRNAWIQIEDRREHDVQIVTETNWSSCSDPRDYIYGVASLFLDAEYYKIDYTQSEAEVFADFTIHCLLNSDNFDVLDESRPTMEAVKAHSKLRSDLPSWCPDWSVAEGLRALSSEIYRRGWKADCERNIVYSRPSRLTLALKGVIAARIKLCNESLLNWIDGEYRWIWFEHREHLRAFIKLQGFRIDQSAKDNILRIFDRLLHAKHVEIETPFLKKISSESRLLFDQVGQDRLISLLAPVYLAAVDPELLKATGLEIDARILSEDYPVIRDLFRHLLSHHGQGTRLFVTENGMQGAGYPGVRPGDLVCIIYGSNVPQVLRQVDADDHDHYILVGVCNVDGLMYGEGLKMGLTEQEFILV